jgi:ribosomal-protein-alanine N-acetyltransferase
VKYFLNNGLSSIFIKMNTNFNLFPTLTTKRLILRQLDMSDVEALSLLRSDAAVNKYLNRPKTTNKEQAEEFVNKINGVITDEQGIYWAICLKEDNVLIGTVCFWNFALSNDMADLGYELSPAHHGKGLMNEAVEGIIKYGFDQMGLKIILGVTHPENEKSLNVLKRNGFVEDVDFVYVSKEDAAGDRVYFLKRQ